MKQRSVHYVIDQGVQRGVWGLDEILHTKDRCGNISQGCYRRWGSPLLTST